MKFHHIEAVVSGDIGFHEELVDIGVPELKNLAESVVGVLKVALEDDLVLDIDEKRLPIPGGMACAHALLVCLACNWLQDVLPHRAIHLLLPVLILGSWYLGFQEGAGQLQQWIDSFTRRYHKQD